MTVADSGPPLIVVFGVQHGVQLVGQVGQHGADVVEHVSGVAAALRPERTNVMKGKVGRLGKTYF